MTDEAPRELDLYSYEVDTPETESTGAELDLYEGVNDCSSAGDEPVVRGESSGSEKATIPEWMLKVWLAFPREIRERYEPRMVIGQGGMGIIVEARDREMDRTVAIKGLKDPSSVLPSLRRRQAHEARISAKLTHPNILPVYDLWQDSLGNPWHSMLRVPGDAPTLSRRLDELRERRLVESRPLSELFDIFLQVCRAVAFSHDQGIAHRDLKPDNIFLGPSGEALVADWGVAVELSPGQPETEDYVGTIGYASPEQFGAFGSLAATAGSDIYSLGVVLFELVVGRRHTDSPTGLAGGATSLNATSATLEIPERVPRELAAIVRRATAYRPEDRFATVRELIRAIEAYLDGGLVDGLSYSPRERALKWARSRPALTGALLSGVFFLGLILAGSVRQGQIQARLLAEANRNLSTALAEKATGEMSAHRLGRARHLAVMALDVGSRGAGLPPTGAASLLAGAGSRGGMAWTTYMDPPPIAAGPVTGDGLVMVADSAGVIREWDAASGAPIRTVHSGSRISHMVVQSASRVTFATVDPEPRILSTASTRNLSLPEQLLDLTVSKDGSMYLAVTRAGGVYFWATADGSEEPARIGSRDFHALCADFAPVYSTVSNPLAAIGGRDRTVRIWDARTGAERAAIQGFDHAVGQVRFSPDGKLLAVSGMANDIRVWDVGAWREAFRLRDHTATLTALEFSSSGRWLASGDASGELRIWDMEAARLRSRLEGHRSTLLSLRFSRDARTLTSTSSDGTLRVWDTAASALASVPALPEGVAATSLRFRDGFLEVKRGDDTSLLLAVPGGQVVDFQPARESGVAEAPRTRVQLPGKGMEAAILQGKIRLSNLQTGEPLLDLDPGHSTVPLALDADPSGRWLVSLTGEGQIRFWDLRIPAGNEQVRARFLSASLFTGRGTALVLREPAAAAPAYAVDHPFRWLPAARGGDAEAQWRAGLLLSGGLGGSSPLRDAGHEWIRRAAAAGHEPAARYLKKL